MRFMTAIAFHDIFYAASSINELCRLEGFHPSARGFTAVMWASVMPTVWHSSFETEARVREAYGRKLRPIDS